MPNDSHENLSTTIERCPHDRQNPYVMISREMAQDKSISPKAKGVLLYLFSLPPNWKIYHSQLQDALGVGEEYINSTMHELIEAGYAERTRERINGQYQPYKYIIREFKKFPPNREIPSGDFSQRKTPPHDGLNQTGFPSPENPVLLNIYRENKQQLQQTTDTAAAAAVSFDAALKEVDIPITDKIEITKTYSTQAIKHAVDWASHPSTKINTTLIQALKWACKTQPEIQPTKQEQQQQQQKQADDLQAQIESRRYFGRHLQNFCFNYLKEKNLDIHEGPLASNDGTYLEFRGRDPLKILYKEQAFKHLVECQLRKQGFFLPDFFGELQ